MCHHYQEKREESPFPVTQILLFFIFCFALPGKSDCSTEKEEDPFWVSSGDGGGADRPTAACNKTPSFNYFGLSIPDSLYGLRKKNTTRKSFFFFFVGTPLFTEEEEERATPFTVGFRHAK